MKIFYLFGKSSSGKNTIYDELIKQMPNLKHIPEHTTRPMRNNETNGNEYYFDTELDYNRLKASGNIIEERSYNTEKGLWRYYTVIEKEQLATDDVYIMIGTLESFHKIKEKCSVIPIYITLDDGLRLERALTRERSQKNPNYKELCRRFLADKKDFSQENLAKEQVNSDNIFYNYNFQLCANQILTFIKENI